MAIIELELNVRAEIGISPSELGREQALTVGLYVEVADQHSDAAARTGNISETLDYGELRSIVHETFTGDRRYSLLEEVTTAVRDKILAIAHVKYARVSVTKHHPWADVPRLTLTR